MRLEDLTPAIAEVLSCGLLERAKRQGRAKFVGDEQAIFLALSGMEHGAWRRDMAERCRPTQQANVLAAADGDEFEYRMQQSRKERFINHTNAATEWQQVFEENKPALVAWLDRLSQAEEKELLKLGREALRKKAKPWWRFW